MLKKNLVPSEAITFSLKLTLTPIVFFSNKGPFALRAWKKAFFLSFIDLRLRRAVKIEASAKKSNKTNKECFFHARSGNGPLDSTVNYASRVPETHYNV